MSETPFMRRLMLTLTNIGLRMFRNNVGMLEDRNGQKVRYGLYVGSSDLIGWNSMQITPDMVGETVAVFVAIETKWDSPLTEEQKNFLGAVASAGGIAFVCKPETNITLEIGRWRPWKQEHQG